MRLFWALMFCLPLLCGCGPAVPRDDLGTVVNEVPEVPGAEEPNETSGPASPTAESEPD